MTPTPEQVEEWRVSAEEFASRTAVIAHETGRWIVLRDRHFAALAFAAGSRSDTRPCTCHPNDNPPKPCPKKYALSECRAVGEDARDAARWREIEARMVHQRCGPNIGWTLPDLLPGDSPEDAIDAAMGGNDA